MGLDLLVLCTLFSFCTVSFIPFLPSFFLFFFLPRIPLAFAWQKLVLQPPIGSLGMSGVPFVCIFFSFPGMTELYCYSRQGQRKKGVETRQQRININSNSNGWHGCSGTRDPVKQERTGDIFVQGPIRLVSWGPAVSTTSQSLSRSFSAFSLLFFFPRGRPIASFLPFSFLLTQLTISPILLELHTHAQTHTPFSINNNNKDHIPALIAI